MEPDVDGPAIPLERFIRLPESRAIAYSPRRALAGDHVVGALLGVVWRLGAGYHRSDPGIKPAEGLPD
jgi:hypothetical protein